MKLHEAIEKLIQQAGQPMDAGKISEALNANKWYRKADGTVISAAQINARVKNYPLMFTVNRSVKPMLIDVVSEAVSINPRSKVSANPKIETSHLTVPTSRVKTSFAPLFDERIQILILGTLPGDESLRKMEYYGHARNRFWKVVAGLSLRAELTDYASKKSALFGLGIGLWDVVHSSERKGSLDSAIREEQVNDLESFMHRQSDISLIAFNGNKAQVLYDKYFKRRANIRYVTLPSTSPANASWNLERLLNQWRSALGMI
ncbi:hypothetical protein ASU31_12935 [Pedobacter ginsenosidimutans]|uniref:Uracil-DNA glycosylase-like domain-containing protein n=1 Tax=Pedobacter ginsenosidimutans TaxID=687842 RepID=A0A0T5VQF4_9SPHI|nr:DNA-deoxyinosine glycosylase [Pedobacter ginsenosidimutans]KRT15881.1 hypothetical protein ASU31_12935 [Pedobacter ginsenosidimutans]